MAYLLVTGGGILFAQAQTSPRWARTVETVTRVDINQDGHIGAPPDSADVWLRTWDGKHGVKAPLSHDLMKEVARLLLSGRRTLAFNQWEQRGAKRILSRDQLTELRDWFTRHNLCEDHGGNVGLQFNEAGREALQRLVDGDMPRLPAPQRVRETV